jgi:hypothetical protein
MKLSVIIAVGSGIHNLHLPYPQNIILAVLLVAVGMWAWFNRGTPPKK